MSLIDKLPSDIIKNIFNQFDFVSQCNVRLVSTYFTICPITNLFDGVPNLNKLTDVILKSYPYTIQLYAGNNKKITNIGHLVHLEVLSAWGNCGIDDMGIKSLTKLTKLNVGDNHKITDINHLINLRILYAGDNCGISDLGINKLTNLVELYSWNNKKITNM